MRPLAVLLTAAAVAALAPAAAAATKRSVVLDTFARMEAAGTVTPEEREAWTTDWRAARHAARRLRGDEQEHLQGVVRNTRALAKRRMLGARARQAMLIVDRNLEHFWDDGAQAPAIGTRRKFPGSRLVFQLYRGSGWQLQPLANLGRLNALTRRATLPQRAQPWADELLGLAVARRGTLRLEYLFPWAGGRPGWASAMPQALALEVYARLARRTGDTRYRDAARLMLEVLREPPPHGLRMEVAEGRDHLLMYPQAPGLMIGNGFAQAVLSLHAYVALDDHPAAREVLDRALAQAREGLPAHDTGDWSLYLRRPDGSGQESDLHYHRLFTGFLGRLCDRLGEPVFCGLRDRFARYEGEPVRLGPVRVSASRRSIGARVWLSKRSAVEVTLRRGDEVLGRRALSGMRGTARARFRRPARKGLYRVTVQATSLTGLVSTAEASRELRRRPRGR